MPFYKNGACGTGVLVYWVTYSGDRACRGTTRRPSSFFVKMASRRALRPESTNGVRVTATLRDSVLVRERLIRGIV